MYMKFPVKNILSDRSWIRSTVWIIQVCGVYSKDKIMVILGTDIDRCSYDFGLPIVQCKEKATHFYCCIGSPYHAFMLCDKHMVDIKYYYDENLWAPIQEITREELLSLLTIVEVMLS